MIYRAYGIHHQCTSQVFGSYADMEQEREIPRVELPIWMLSPDGDLIRVARELERSPDAILNSLFLGPTFTEVSRGIFTAVLPNASFEAVVVDELEVGATCQYH